MEDGSLEISGKEQVAAASDVQNRPRIAFQVQFHQVSHRVILDESLRLHPHSEGIEPCQVLVVFGFQHTGGSNLFQHR